MTAFSVLAPALWNIISPPPRSEVNPIPVSQLKSPEYVVLPANLGIQWEACMMVILCLYDSAFQ